MKKQNRLLLKELLSANKLYGACIAIQKTAYMPIDMLYSCVKSLQKQVHIHNVEYNTKYKVVYYRDYPITKCYVVDSAINTIDNNLKSMAIGSDDYNPEIQLDLFMGLSVNP